MQIDKLKDSLCNAKKSYCSAEAALTKEHSQVKDLEQELKDLKSRSQVEANTSALPQTTLVEVEPKTWVVVPAWSLPLRKELLGTVAKSFIDRPCPPSREGGGTKQNRGGQTHDEE